MTAERLEDGRVAIRLNDLELWACWELARRRHERKAKTARDRRVDKSRNILESHYIGIKAEYAAARFYSLGIDMRAYKGGDNGGDLELNGRKIDVKNRQRDLLIPYEPRADFYILTNPLTRSTPFCDMERDRRIRSYAKHAFKHVLIVGWIERAGFLEQHEIVNLGHGDHKMLKRERLNDPFSFFEIIRKFENEAELQRKKKTQK